MQGLPQTRLFRELPGLPFVLAPTVYPPEVVFIYRPRPFRGSVQFIPPKPMRRWAGISRASHAHPKFTSLPSDLFRFRVRWDFCML